MTEERRVNLQKSVIALGAVFAAVAMVGSATVWAQSFKLVVAQGGDGTLYLLTDHGRYTLVPVGISDDELNASVDLGPVDGDNLAIAWPTPAPTVAPIVTSVSPTATPVPVAAPEPFTPIQVSGRGEEATRPFRLPGGNFTSEWRISGGSPTCFKTVRLLSTSRQIPTTTILPTDYYGAAQKTGTTQVYNLPAGDYYANGVGGGCDWAITLLQLR